MNKQEKVRAYLYVHEKLSSAIYTLAIGSGDVRSRLHDAYINIMTLSPKDFPLELKEDFKFVINELTKHKPSSDIEKKYEGSLGVTLRRMRNATGVKIARKITYLDSKIEGYINHLRSDQK